MDSLKLKAHFQVLKVLVISVGTLACIGGVFLTLSWLISLITATVGMAAAKGLGVVGIGIAMYTIFYLCALDTLKAAEEETLDVK